MQPVDRMIDVGVQLHIREWRGEGAPFLLVHGLASNARTWDLVGETLAAEGHHVVAVDQRGHGLSQKVDNGYGFDSVTADLHALVAELGLERPYLAGQSWGGNVVLAFGAAYPGVARGLALVDGGFIDLQSRPESTWEVVADLLQPPHLEGLGRDAFKQMIVERQLEWGEAEAEMVLGNFETLADGTIRPWLTRPRHMLILRALWEQRPPALYPHITEPVLICVAGSGDPSWREQKVAQVAAAEEGLRQVEVVWFENTVHDIHIHRPVKLARLFLSHDAANHGLADKIE